MENDLFNPNGIRKPRNSLQKNELTDFERTEISGQ